MMEVALARWSVWTPPAEPEVGFLPPLMRRRCTRLTRAMLHVAFRVATAEELPTLPAVFGSRHGEVAATLTLLEKLGRCEPLAASGFSHSVHNAQVGLFSIAAKNRGITSAVAAGGDTFGAAFLEAVTTMRRGGHERALLVVGDDVLPDVFSRFSDEPTVPYAVAVLLGSEGRPLTFAPGVGGTESRSNVPPALEFVRWLERDEATFTFRARTPYTWMRRDAVDGPTAEGG